MGRKGIILALVIFIGLGLYVFFVERKKPVSEGKKEIILKFDKDKARRLILSRDGKEIVLDRDKDGKWQITSPILTKADDEAVKDLVNGLSGLESSQVLEVLPSEWEDFGLRKPKCEVIILIEANRKEKLSFGDKNPAGTSTYARMRGKDKVYLVSTYAADGFKKSVFDLRNKIILSFERDKIDKIGLIYPEKSLVMERQRAKKEGEEDKWFLAGGEKIELDSDKVNDILWELTDLKAKDIVAEKINDPAAYGLDVPEVKAVINVGGVEKKIMLGKKASEKEDTIYASVEGDPRLFLVSDELSSRLKKDLSELKKTAPPVAQGGVVEKKEEKQD